MSNTNPTLGTNPTLSTGNSLSTGNTLSTRNIFSLGRNFFVYICTYCCFSFIMICIAIFNCGDIMEYFCALLCPCLYLFYIIGKYFRGCNNYNYYNYN